MTQIDRTSQAPIRPTTQAPIRPTAEPEAPSLAWLAIVGATFGVVILKESVGRLGGPVVVGVRSIPRLPAPFWTALVLGGLERIGARVLGIRIGQS